MNEALDRVRFRQLAELLDDAVGMILQQYEQMLEDHLLRLEDAVAQQRHAAIAAIAHSLKAPCRQMGAMRAGDLAERLEGMSAKVEGDVSEYQCLTAELRCEAENALAMMKQELALLC
jgi:HPt (histidine-containing phosphotransfer) domain-containing protein